MFFKFVKNITDTKVAIFMPKNNSEDIYILSIESSCDDTAAAVLKNNEVLSNLIARQHIHEQYGGVVPELASRAHQQNIVPVVEVALQKAGIHKQQLHAIAYTQGPGLIGSLLVGGAFAKAMAQGLQIPLISVHHMQAHILAHFIKDEAQKIPEFPFLAATISGGHTQLVKVSNFFDFEILGETTDDAIGECFDKTAKILALPYPGGPLIDKFAQEGNPEAFTFTIPKVPDFDFSFSGLKTQIMNFVQKETHKNPQFIETNKADICASVQHIIIKILMRKIEAAVEHTGIKSVAIGGGVSANSGIRNTLKAFENSHGWQTFIPKFEYTTDNAAMIGIVGYYKYLNKQFSRQDILSKSRMPL